MKIRFVVPCNDLSGGLKVVADYGNHLISRGHSVSVIFPRVKRNLRQQLRYLYNRYVLGHRTHLDKFKGTVIGLDTISTDSFRSVDVVVVTAWETAALVQSLNLTNTRIIYLIQGYETWNAKSDAVDATFRFPFTMVTVSSWLSELVAEKSGKHAIPVLPNGITKSEEEISIHGRLYAAGMVYSSIPNKGSRHGIQVLWELHRQDPSRRFVVFGSDTPDQLLPPGTDFFLKPSQQKIKKIYQSSKIWLVNSYREGFGLPALEAMNAGCTVISSDNYGVRDVITHGVDGWIVQPGDEKAMIQLAETLLNDLQSLVRISICARETVNKFSWEKTITRFEYFLNMEGKLN